jgi:hypothetical protein
VEEYGTTQVSINLTNIEETPLHAAFDACVESAIAVCESPALKSWECFRRSAC